jgi:hypothetical protein
MVELLQIRRNDEMNTKEIYGSQEDVLANLLLL